MGLRSTFWTAAPHRIVSVPSTSSTVTPTPTSTQTPSRARQARRRRRAHRQAHRAIHRPLRRLPLLAPASLFCDDFPHTESHAVYQHFNDPDALRNSEPHPRVNAESDSEPAHRRLSLRHAYGVAWSHRLSRVNHRCSHTDALAAGAASAAQTPASTGAGTIVGAALGGAFVVVGVILVAIRYKIVSVC
jgi:hypothetical protein